MEGGLNSFLFLSCSESHRTLRVRSRYIVMKTLTLLSFLFFQLEIVLDLCSLCTC